MAREEEEEENLIFQAVASSWRCFFKTSFSCRPLLAYSLNIHRNSLLALLLLSIFINVRSMSTTESERLARISDVIDLVVNGRS